MDGTLDASELPGACALCHRILSSENEASDLEADSICGDCKFLFLEDNGTPTRDIQRRIPRVRRTRDHNSSESIENMFSQQFSNMINLARYNQPTASEHENQSIDSVQRTSSRTTPSGSRRWRRVFSDTESDGFDSVYGESDVMSNGAYVGDSDVSVDGHSFLDNDMFAHPDSGSLIDSDTDIDPMHAGLNQWNSDEEDDDNDDDDEEEDNEWEEVDGDGNTLDSLVARVRLHRSLASNGRNLPVNWLREINSPEIEGAIRIRIGERRRIPLPNLFGNLEDQETSPYVGNSGDYLDARGFEELLERLAETDSSRRGAPPAALSFVNNLEQVVVNEYQDNGLACAICKDSLSVGAMVNRLPCNHLYHPSCIMPWLSARNSCPLCRYELPTDDKHYENRKQGRSMGLRIHEMENQDGNEEDTYSEEDEDPEVINHGRGGSYSIGDGGRGRWFRLAAPIVSLVGIALVLWLGNPRAGRTGLFGAHDFPVQGQVGIQATQGSGSCPPSQRENRSRRWWSLF